MLGVKKSELLVDMVLIMARYSLRAEVYVLLQCEITPAV
jgi:hypothetical protein